MNQDDFRQLLASSKTVAPIKTKTKSNPATTRKPPSFKKPSNHHKNNRPSNTLDKKPELPSGYRDRAKERREGKNNDYSSSDKMLEMLNQTSAEATPVLNSVETSKKDAAYHQSKFLGGDLEHTHLVKGLDFTLLKKVKSDLKVEESPIDEDQAAKDYVEKLHGQEGDVSFTSNLVESIYNLAVLRIDPEDKPMDQKSDIFERMTYKFDLTGPIDLPVTFMKSKNEARRVRDDSNNLVLDKVIQVISNLRSGSMIEKKSKGKDKGKIVKELTPIKPTVDDDSDDGIFADVGSDYVLEVKNKKTAEEEVKDKKTAEGPSKNNIPPTKFRYFDDEEDQEKDDNTTDPVIDPEIMKIIQSKEKTPVHIEEQDEGGDIMKPLPRSNHLSSMMDYEGAYDDESDDEVDEDEHMDYGTNKNKKRQLTRYDFESESEWAAYKSSQTHIPKAAFSFGQKGQQPTTKKSNATDEEKLNSELQKIDKEMKRKYSKGVFEEKESSKDVQRKKNKSKWDDDEVEEEVSEWGNRKKKRR